MDPLTIVQIAPLDEAVPPKKYGGTELVVFNLTEELVKRGHKVYLIASEDSKTHAELLSIFSQGTRLFVKKDQGEAKHRKLEILKLEGMGKIVEKILQIKEPIDIIHNHLGWRLFPFLRLMGWPTVTTLHGDLHEPMQKLSYRRFKHFPFISISKNQRKGFPNLNYIGNVYNGIDLSGLQYSHKKQNYFAFLGRTSPEKGIKEAIWIAKSAGVRLKIAAKVDAADAEFFEREVKPLIDDNQIIFIGEVNAKQKSEFLRNAMGLIAPIQWEEPFGLYFTEAMACGTPVLSFKRGSVNEVVIHKKTGFIAKPNDVDTLVKWVKYLANLDAEKWKKLSRACRRHVERNFSTEEMTNEYEKLYRKMMRQS